MLTANKSNSLHKHLLVCGSQSIPIWSIRRTVVTPKMAERKRSATVTLNIHYNKPRISPSGLCTSHFHCYTIPDSKIHHTTLIGPSSPLTSNNTTNYKLYLMFPCQPASTVLHSSSHGTGTAHLKEAAVLSRLGV